VLEQITAFLESLGFTKVDAQLEFLLDPSSIPTAIWETLYAPLLAALFAYVIGMPLGILLVTGAADGIHPIPKWILTLLNTVINLLRSIPFLILMVLVFPLSRLILGTAIGTTATIVPVARVILVEVEEIPRLRAGLQRQDCRGVVVDGGEREVARLVGVEAARDGVEGGAFEDEPPVLDLEAA
jgi:ABC-type amino acid transport system permease subunit